MAVDQSPEMLAVARGKAHSQGLTVTLVEGALEDGLPFASGSFDLVMCALALNHVPDLTGAIRDCCRVLRSRGHLIITDFHPQAIENGWETTLFRGEDAYILPNPKHSRDGYLEAIAAGSCDILHVEEVLVREQPRESIVAPDYDAFMDQYGDWPFCLIILARRRAESS